MDATGIRELFNSRQDKIPLIRVELRHLLDGQILMTPTGEGKGRHYVATVRGRPLAILGEIPGVSLLRSPTGNRTVSYTCQVLRIPLLNNHLSPRTLEPEVARAA